MQQSIPQAMQAIRQSVTQTVTDLNHAQNSVRALMGETDLGSVSTAWAGSLPELLIVVQQEVAATVNAFADLAAFVHGWTTGNVQNETPLDTPIVTTAVVRGVEAALPAMADAIMTTRKADPIPENKVAPTLAGGILQPTRITVDPVPVPMLSPEPTPTPDPLPEPDDDGDPDRDHAAVPVNRVAHHLENGHVEPGEELATVLGVGSDGLDESTGKRQRNRRKKN